MAFINQKNMLMLAIIQSIKEGKPADLQKIVDELQPFDIAQQYEKLPAKYRNRFLHYLPTEQLTWLMHGMEKDKQLDVLKRLGMEDSKKVFDLMDNDDMASLLSGLSSAKVEKLLSGVNHYEKKAIQNLIDYPTETAGRLMSDRYVWIPIQYTIQEAVTKLKDFINIAEYLNYLYVVDDKNKLMGVVSYRGLLLADPAEKIENIMFRKVIKSTVDTDQEEVAKLISRYNFVSLPIVEQDNTLVGIITVDDIIDVFIQEANEDIEKLSASGKAITFATKPLQAACRRLPWLILLLFVGFVSGGIISSFAQTLKNVVALTFFMPMIAGMTGNTGTQSLAIVVRGLVSHELDFKHSIKLIVRELCVGVLIGTICGIFIAVIAYLWQGTLAIGLVVGISLFLTLIIGTMSGTIIPLILYKLKIDPAIASGPLITTINDILSLLIYFGIATAALSNLM